MFGGITAGASRACVAELPAAAAGSHEDKVGSLVKGAGGFRSSSKTAAVTVFVIAEMVAAGMAPAESS